MRIALFLVAACAAAFGDTLVVPNNQAAAPGNAPFQIGATAAHIQEVLGTGQFAEFTSPIVITALRVRAAAGTGPLSVQYANVKITLSTTQLYPNSTGNHTLLGTTFANNVGKDAVVVYNGPASMNSPGCAAPGPCPFDIVIPFTTPFAYDNSLGRPLVDLVVSAPTKTPVGSFDGVSFPDTTTSTVYVVFAADPTLATGTPIVGGEVFGLDNGFVNSAEVFSAPSGSFGFLLNATFSEPANNSGFGFIGVMTFDGAGNVSGPLTAEFGADGSKPARTLTGTFTGNYFSYPNGTGGVTISVLGVAFEISLNMVITDGGQGMQLVATNCSGNCNLGGTLVTGVARTASPGTLQGNYGFVLDNTPIPSGTLGSMSFDGAGNVSLTYTSVGVGSDVGNVVAPPPVSGETLTGTYTVNPDGSGTMSLVSPTGVPQGSFAFVMTDGGAGMLLMLTDGTDTNVTYGTARMQ